MTKPELQAFIDHHDLAVISTLADLNQRPWNIQEMIFS